MHLILLLLSLSMALAEPESRDATPAEIQGWLGSVVMLVTGPGWCSGVLIDDQGTVATAYHCVASGRRPRVELQDGRHGIGRTIAVSAREDIALVSVPALSVANGGPPPLALRPDLPEVGERVYGLGHPYAPLTETSPAMEGLLRWSATEGIVSNMGERFLQTDAALNPGNSGGPVVDAQGRIVGIVSRKLNGDNLAFAVKVDRLAAMVAAPKRPGPLGGELSFGLSLSSLLGTGDALTWSLGATASLRDRAVLTLYAGLPSGAPGLAETFGQSRYTSASASLGARGRLGRGRWSTSLEAGPHLAMIGAYTAEEGQSVQAQPMVPSPGAYGRIELSGLGVRTGVTLVDGAPVWSLGVELGAPIGHSTF